MIGSNALKMNPAIVSTVDWMEVDASHAEISCYRPANKHCSNPKQQRLKVIGQNIICTTLFPTTIGLLQEISIKQSIR